MIEIHELTDEARKHAHDIQAVLNRGNYEEARVFLTNIVEGVDEATVENLMSGATFTINYPANSPSTGNSLLHVGLYARVNNNVMEKLLNLGVNHLAESHVNSDDLTPIEYADTHFKEDDNVVDLRNTISDYYHEHTSCYDEYLTELVREVVQNNRIENNRITVDIGPIVSRNHERSMFNSSESISEHIYAFIDLSKCPGAIYETGGTTITFICEDEDNDIALLAQVKDA